MTAVLEAHEPGTLQPPLSRVGVGVLLVYGAAIRPPRGGRPGVAVDVDGRGVVRLEARGYAVPAEANTAICAAAQACLDAGLRVSFGPADRPMVRIVRRVP